MNYNDILLSLKDCGTRILECNIEDADSVKRTLENAAASLKLPGVLRIQEIPAGLSLTLIEGF